MSKQAYKVYNTRQKPKMCLHVRVFYQCGCDATVASGLWSCHGYVHHCYDRAGRECNYMLANDCGRPTCQGVKNYWSWHVHHGLCDQQRWLSFIQSYGRWCDAGANNQLSSQEVIQHPYEHDRPVWTPQYPRYHQPGFNFLAFSERSHPFKAKDQTPPPWPILDIPSAMLGGDHEEYPALNMVVGEEDIECHVDIRRRLTIEQVHLHMLSLFVGFGLEVPDRRGEPV